MRSREEQIKALAACFGAHDHRQHMRERLAELEVREAEQRGRELEREERKTDDTCRLDFMEHSQIDAMKANGQWEILSMSGDTAETIGAGDTMRAAIDAAMKEVFGE